MQCASSMAIERGLAPGEHLREAGDAHALGRDEEELEVAVEVVAAGLAGRVAGEAGVDARDAEAGCGSLSAWSSISAMSGETTRPVPPRASAGSW